MTYPVWVYTPALLPMGRSAWYDDTPAGYAVAGLKKAHKLNMARREWPKRAHKLNMFPHINAHHDTLANATVWGIYPSGSTV